MVQMLEMNNAETEMMGKFSTTECTEYHGIISVGS